MTESADVPATVTVTIDGAAEGWMDVAQIDASDPGAKTRATSLAEIVHDALEMAAVSWFEPCRDSGRT